MPIPLLPADSPRKMRLSCPRVLAVCSRPSKVFDLFVLFSLPGPLPLRDRQKGFVVSRTRPRGDLHSVFPCLDAWKIGGASKSCCARSVEPGTLAVHRDSDLGVSRARERQGRPSERLNRSTICVCPCDCIGDLDRPKAVKTRRGWEPESEVSVYGGSL